ncbi:MAG: Lipase 1 [Candidatus Anoxychlamydiales bacterium]|nr:Lipase 1 [Candidatus Anoxychlamydiales bacterium]
MKAKTKNIFLVSTLSLLFTFFAIYSYLPLFLSKYSEHKNFKELNLKKDVIYYNDNKDYFEYIEGGEGKTNLLLVHGFQSSKNYWVPFIKHLKKDYNIIALDLPGHGNSSRNKKQKFDLESLTTSLNIFVEKKGLKKFHILGTSMGGGITTLYAHHYPDKVKTLSLLNPLGIDQEDKSDLQLLLEKGQNIFFPKNLKEFDQMTIYLTGKKINFNSYFRKYALSKMMSKYTFFKKVFNELLSSTRLDNVLPNIKTKSLILIGKKDRIIHPSSFEYFVKLIPDIKAKRIDNGTHLFVGDEFKIAIEELKSFLDENSDIED